jgi:hypothetical protein
MAFVSGRLHSPRPIRWRRLLARLLPSSVTYRPEQHYMRGPGPKYRAKHAGSFTPRRSD